MCKEQRWWVTSVKIGCLGRREGKRGQWLRPVKKFDYNISSKIEEPIKIDLRKES